MNELYIAGKDRFPQFSVRSILEKETQKKKKNASHSLVVCHRKRAGKSAQNHSHHHVNEIYSNYPLSLDFGTGLPTKHGNSKSRIWVFSSSLHY